MITASQEVYFFPLYYAANPWSVTMNGLKRRAWPLCVKVIAEPCGRKKDKLRVTLMDVFTVTGQMPPKPSNKENRTYLLDAISAALEFRTGKQTVRLRWGHVLWTEPQALNESQRASQRITTSCLAESQQ